MKTYSIDEKMFEKAPGYCTAVVVARGVDNRRRVPEIEVLLEACCKEAQAACEGKNIRELPGVAAYRQAFSALGVNPNKFMCSAEALAKRVQKGGHLPSINPMVDLGNALSVKYAISLGAHDIDKMEPAGLCVRLCGPEDHYLPIGADGEEPVPEGTPCFISGHTIKTCRWMWRQSEDGKITEETCNLMFPIDGFEGANKEDALRARDELATLLGTWFPEAEVRVGLVEKAGDFVFLD